MKLSLIAALLLLCSSAMASLCSDTKREIESAQKKALKAVQEKRITVDQYRMILDDGQAATELACSFSTVNMCANFERELSLAENNAIKAMRDGKVTIEQGETILSNIESAKEQTDDFCRNIR